MKINGKTILSTSSTTTNYVLKQSSTAGTLINSQIFDNGTNVGIGTTSPIYKLDVNGAISTNSFFRIGDISAQIGVIGSENSIFGAGSNDWTFYNGGATSNVFYTSGTERLRITSAGNVGIGTSSPSEILSVVSSGASVISAFRNSGNASYKIQNSATSAFFGLNGTNNIALGFSADQTDAPLQITSSGNVGIGTTSPEPSSLLDLNSITQGFLAPRMRTSERDSIGSPANGLIIFNTDSETIDVFTNGGGWKSVLFL